MTDPIDSLVEAMGTTAEGYGAIIDGILNIRTVTDTRGGAAMNALYICGYHVIGCNDPECTCREEA